MSSTLLSGAPWPKPAGMPRTEGEWKPNDRIFEVSARGSFQFCGPAPPHNKPPSRLYIWGEHAMNLFITAPVYFRYLRLHIGLVDGIQDSMLRVPSLLLKEEGRRSSRGI